MELDFAKMKRTELQGCAKRAGIRANTKTDQLISSLIAYHRREAETAQLIIQPDSETTEEVKHEEQPAEVKSQRGKRRRGRGHNKDESEENLSVTAEPKEVASSSSETQAAPENEMKIESPVKAKRKRRRAGKRTSVNIKDNVSTRVKTPKSAQKRSHSDVEDEPELPPAKQLKVSSSPKNALLETPPTRKSSRKRTFSTSPKDKDCRPHEKLPSEAENKENTPAVIEMRETRAKRSASLTKKEPEVKEENTEICSAVPKKSMVPVKKTGIPLPKFKTSENVKTPGKTFKKVHKTQFEKMESIDDYLERKRKRTEALTQSFKKKYPTSAKKTPQKGKSAATPKDKQPVAKGISFFSPKPNPISKHTSGIKSVTFHTSKLKTPIRPSTFLFGKPSTEKRVATPGTRKSIAVMNASARKSMSGTNNTIFKFGNTSVVQDTPSKQMKFDLKASLEKPLTYKPHRGKLKPLTEVQPDNPKHGSHVTKAKENLKKPKTTSRQERMKATAKHRTQNRKNAMMTRRGLV